MSGEAPRDHAPRAETQDFPSSSLGGLPGPTDEAELAPRAPADAARRAGSESDEMPRAVFTRRRLLLSALFVGSCVAFLYFVLPKVLGLKDTWSRIQHGDQGWLAVGVLLGCLSFLGCVVLACRALAFWLPTLPGALAYLQLRRTVHHWQDAEPATYT